VARWEQAAESSLPVPSDLQEGVERASALGANLFLLDTSTSRAWDALGAQIGPLKVRDIGHYLALLGGNDEGRPDGSVQVLFFSSEVVPRLTYRVRVAGEAREHTDVVTEDPPRLVHDPLMTLLNARLLALDALPSGKQTVHPVLIPQRDGEIVVYLLAVAKQPDMAVLGRHYRVEVAEDGTQVETVTALSALDLELPTRDSAGQRVAALTVTDNRMDHPTETHVFASRMANLPIYVTTGRGLWKVRPSAIDFLGVR
jgi:hypothetical protein